MAKLNLGIMGGMVKTLIPVVKQNLTSLDEMLVSKLAAVEIQDNEKYVSFNGVNEDGKIIFYVCTCSEDDKVIRQIERVPLDELLLKLLEKC